jgi:hypothetical protein
MRTFTVEIKNLNKISAAYQQAPRIVEPTLQRAINAAAAILAKNTTGKPQGGPVPWRTGHMTLTFAQNKGRLWVRWYPTAKYALWVHEGHRQTHAWGRPMRNPRQIKGQPFMPQIAKRAAPEINKTFANALRIITRKLGS